MISGQQFRDAIISASNNISKYKKQVNELNIFPVPDGDTGSNMSMTISAAASEMEKLPDSVTAGEAAKKAASAMLRAGRGNSGVILSLLFRGFASGLEGVTDAAPERLVNALEHGVESAYKAVMKPTEGTMLTVARVAAEHGREALGGDNGEDTATVWDAVCEGASEALEKTPELLPVLKKAGVVDAGGQGLCLIFDGMYSVFSGAGIVKSALTQKEREEENAEFFRNVAAEFDSVINYTYCTEFIVGRDPEIDTDPLDLRLFLETMGDSVVCVDDEEIIKAHVHTETPGLVLQKALEYGQLLMVKIENMKEQHRRAAEEEAQHKIHSKDEQAASQAEGGNAKPVNDSGFVTVAAGEGLIGLFKDLGCDQVVSGGQTMNPSTDDILKAVLLTPAKRVYVLPNNKNILMAAEQVVPLVEDREVVVIPSRTIPEGISALLAFDGENSYDENKNAMLKAVSNVDTGLVTFADRDAEYDGKAIRQGEILGLTNGRMQFVEKDIGQTCLKVARSFVNKRTSFITLIYGEGVSEEDAENTKTALQKKVSSDIEITLVDGGQPVYYYIISVE